MKTSIYSIPELPAVPAADWPSIEAAMSAGCPVLLGQHWRETLEPELADAQVRLARRGAELFLHAKLLDAQPRNAATVWNQPTHELGDVLELFLWDGAAADYHEFHVTPENQRLQMHLPDPGAIRSGAPLSTWAVAESRFESATRINADHTGWEVWMRVDLAALFGAPPAAFRFLICRYDYQPGRPAPVLSSNGPLTALDFHRLPEWTTAQMA